METSKTMFGLNEIKYLVNAGIFSFSKSKGQNFLIDSNIPKKIAYESEINTTCVAFEVGSGLGALTSQLSEIAKHVVTLELDKRLIPILKDVFSENKNVSIVEGDVLKVNLKKIFDENLPQSCQGCEIHVCANLPYNITSPAISLLIESNLFKTLTFMVQKEVALRIVASPGTSDYGAFSLFSQYHTEPEILFDVSPDCFYPKPAVISSVIKMKIREQKPLAGDAEKLFFKLTRSAFSQRRKTLVNALYSVFSSTHTKDELSQAIEKLGRGDKIRGEVLGVEDYVKLCNYL